MENKMIELKHGDYEKVIPIIQSADINTLFALFVLKGRVKGKVFVDDKDSPTSFYVQHPYGMALLFGESTKEEFYKQLKNHLLNLDSVRNNYEWLQVYPASLSSRIEEIVGSNLIKKDPNEPYKKSFSLEEDKKVLEYQRINFTFNREKYLAFKRTLIEKKYEIVRTSEAIFNQVDGSVVPKYFWNNSTDFVANGLGFTLMENGLPVSTAFSSFIVDDKLELGIETHIEKQGSGFASIVCTKLIDYCHENGYEPIWSCNSGNIASRKLAQKLGFEESIRIPYYRLAK